MTISWGFRRKLIYSSVILTIALLLITFVWIEFFTATPTCFDTKQNGNESGVDCGGSCALVCVDVARDPVVLWARAFPTHGNIYTALAYVQNNNGETSARQVPYIFQFYDADNKLVSEKSGVMDIPPVQTIPVMETNIVVGDRKIARTLFSFSGAPVWQRVVHGSVPQIRVIKQTLASGASRLDATVENDSQQDLQRMTIFAVLFDSEGVARAASRSTVPLLMHTSTQNVVFTWPEGIPDVVRAEISVLPSF